jgi:hypothetical protein
MQSVTVTTTATLIAWVDAAQEVSVENTALTPVWIGPAGVAVGGGHKLEGKSTIGVELADSGELWAVSESTAVVRVAGATFAPQQLLDGSPAANSLKLRPTANKSNSSSVGGALYIDNSASTGVGLGVYSTQAAPAGNLAFFRANNASFSQRAVRVEHAGTGIGVDVNHTGTGIGLQVVGSGGATAGSKHALAVSLANTGSTTSSAGSFSSANEAHSAVQVTGVETDRGTVKVTHVKPAGSDANAAALSLDMQGDGTACQGLYITSTASTGTTGDLIDARNGSSAFRWRLTSGGYVVQTVPTAAYSSSSMWNGSMSVHVNEGSNQLTFTVRYSNGTVKTGTVTLA